MVGVFPPPVHGMAVVNARMYEHLSSGPMQPLVLDLAPASLGRNWSNRLSRIRKIARAGIRFSREVFSGGGTTLYVGLSGGWGQFYEIAFVAMGRLRGAHIFLHHHSFAYLDRRMLPTRLLTRLAGTRAVHVVICETQGKELRQCYPVVSRTRVVSNAAIMAKPLTTKTQTRSSVGTIGFLGNISREKGIMEVLAVAARLENQQTEFEVRIAGPFDNVEVEGSVRKALSRLRTVKYFGALYGHEKEQFLDHIDVLLFPSRYPNETAPLVIHEAMAHGVPVIAWARGCVADMVSPGSGLTVPRTQDFVTAAADCLLRWKQDPAAFASVSGAAIKEFARQREQSQNSFFALLNELDPNIQPVQVREGGVNTR